MYVVALLLAAVSVVTPKQHRPNCVECPVTFTFDEAGWTQAPPTSVIGSAFGVHSAPVALSLTGDGVTEIPDGSQIEVPGLVVGMTYGLSAWVNADLAVEEFPLRISIGVPNAETYVFTVAKSAVGTGWQLVTLGSFVQWHSVFFTDDQRVLRANLAFVGGPLGGGPVLGRWGVDDIELVSVEAEDMAKRREIREALVARLQTVTVGNGYALTLGEVSTGPVRIPDGVNTWPHVSLLHGEEIKTVHTLGRTKGLITFYAGVACKRTDTSDPDDQCDDACAEIEKAARLFANGQFLALGYVENVFVGGVDPVELTPEIARDITAWMMPIEVTYTYVNGQP